MKELDEYCSKILVVLLLKKEAHFNELFRLVNKKGKKISRPTFNTHLKHLIEAGYVTRTPDKGQLVLYSLNLEKIGNSKETADRVKRITRTEYETKKEFFALSEEKQVNIVLHFFTQRKLYEIKAGIEHLLDPDSFEKWLGWKFWSHPILERVSLWMIKKCVEDEDYRKRTLKIIDDVLET